MPITQYVSDLASTIAAYTIVGTTQFWGAVGENTLGVVRDFSRKYEDVARGLAWFQDLTNGISAAEPNSPPQHLGRPLVGNALDFLIDPVAVLESGYMKKGPIFSLKLGPQNVVVLIGPEHHRFFFHNTDKSLSFDVYRSLKKMFAENVYFFAQPAEYEKQRDVIVPRFKKAAMESYVAAMIEETESFLGPLGDRGQLELPRDLGPLVMYIAARALLGKDFRNQMGKELFDTFRIFSGGIEEVLPPDTPLPRLLQSKRAKQTLHRMFQEAINNRRKSPKEPKDFLQSLLEDAKDQKFDDELIRHLIMLMVWAGHETTVGHTAWVLADLLRNPSYLAEVVKEQHEVIQNGLLTPENLPRLRKMEWAIKESERLHPVAFILMRKAMTDFKYEGFQVRKNDLVMISPSVAHRLPTVFQNPATYDPQRFAPGREEDRKTPYSLIGFGGGGHRCAGVNFAYQEMSIILTILLRDYNLRLLNRDIRPVRGGKTRWPAPFLIQYTRRKKSHV